MTQANAICIERGTAFGPEYFNRLYSGVAALAKLDQYWEMRKVSLFMFGLIPDLDGPLPRFDLDVVITGPLDPLLSAQN